MTKQAQLLCSYLMNCNNLPAIIAHRGLGLHYPENTIAAFRAAVQAGADMVEMDAYGTKNGEFLVYHHEQHFQTQGAKPPSLAACIEALGSTPINLDIKGCRHPSHLQNYLGNHALPPDSVVSSFDYSLLVSLSKAEFPYPIFLILSVAPSRSLRHNLRNSVLSVLPSLVPTFLDGLAVNHRLLSKRLIRVLHRKDKKVYTWTVDEPSRLERLAAWGVDGVITKCTDLFSRCAPLRSSDGSSTTA